MPFTVYNPNAAGISTVFSAGIRAAFSVDQDTGILVICLTQKTEFSKKK